MTDGAVRIERFEDPTSFLAFAGEALAAREAEHNLIFGICANLVSRGDPAPGSEPPYLAAATLDGRVVGTAIMTPPWNLVLGHVDDPAAVPAFAADLVAGGITLPGIEAAVGTAATFAEPWAATHGLVATRKIVERIYQVERIVPPVGVSGAVRVASGADRDLLVAWMIAFSREALNRDDDAASEAVVDRGLRHGERTFYLWEDGGRPVSLAGVGGPTPNGIRVGPVYTPPSVRGHGYASAVTAAASQAQFDAGRQFVFLFTNLADPTPNKIYQQIGYRPVMDVDLFVFRPADA